jgi:hypothetical protein
LSQLIWIGRVQFSKRFTRCGEYDSYYGDNRYGGSYAE